MTDPPEQPARSMRERISRLPKAIVREVRSRPFAYVVFGSFVVAGPFVVGWMFPEASLAVGVIGGICFGGYAALCAVPQKFL